MYLRLSVLPLLLAGALPAQPVVERLTRQIERDLEREVEERVAAKPTTRLADLLDDLAKGATIEDAIGKQLHSVATGLAIKALFLPAIDSVPLAARRSAEPELRDAVASVVARYSARGVAAYCSANDRDCACLTASEIAKRVGADLTADLQKHPKLWLISFGEGPDAVIARLAVRTSVYLSEEMVKQAGEVLRSSARPGSYCATLQAGARRLDAARIQSVAGKALDFGPGRRD
jgi:hypothetical protein